MKENTDRSMQGNPDFGIQEFLFVESGILGFGIRDTVQGDGIPITIGIRNSSSTNTRIQYLESGIQRVESRIQDCLRFTYMERY